MSTSFFFNSNCHIDGSAFEDFFQFDSVTVIVISLIFVLYINFVGIDYIPFSNLFIEMLKG